MLEDSLISGIILLIALRVCNVHRATQQKIQESVPLLLRWYQKAARDLPWRATTNPYAIWVSEIMLQQTQVKTVIPYFNRWMERFPDIKTLANATEDEVLKLWSGLGYYSRARNLHRAAKSLAGGFPTDYEAILELPGVGRYTAGAIASTAFNKPAPILDGNVVRVLTRLFAFTAPARKLQAKLWSYAGAFVNATQKCSQINQSLMELGATVCTPRNPSCPACPLVSQCAAFKQRKVHLCPNVEKPKPFTTIHRIAYFAEKTGKVLLRKRLTGEHNAGLWGFPALPVEDAGIGQTIKSFRHTITTNRIKVDLRAGVPPKLPESCEWISWKKLSELPMASIDSRILDFIRSQLPARAEAIQRDSGNRLPAASSLAGPQSSILPLPAR